MSNNNNNNNVTSKWQKKGRKRFQKLKPKTAKKQCPKNACTPLYAKMFVLIKYKFMISKSAVFENHNCN